MSQHSLTVVNDNGLKLHLVAGWDRPLQQFFLSIYYADRPGDPGACIWDSQSTVEGIVGYRNIGEVERTLQHLRIPFGEPDGNPQQVNLNLLPLLCWILEEKDGSKPSGNVIKNWDLEPEPKKLSAQEIATQQQIQQEANQRYSIEKPHPTYTVAGWLQKNAGREGLSDPHYNFWVYWCIINQKVVDTQYNPFAPDETGDA